MKVVWRIWEAASIFFVVPTQNRAAIEDLISIVKVTAIVIEPNLQLEAVGQTCSHLEVKLIFGESLRFKRLNVAGLWPYLKLADDPAEQ